MARTPVNRRPQLPGLHCCSPPRPLRAPDVVLVVCAPPGARKSGRRNAVGSWPAVELVTVASRPMHQHLPHIDSRCVAPRVWYSASQRVGACSARTSALIGWCWVDACVLLAWLRVCVCGLHLADRMSHRRSRHLTPTAPSRTMSPPKWSDSAPYSLVGLPRVAQVTAAFPLDHPLVRTRNQAPAGMT